MAFSMARWLLQGGLELLRVGLWSPITAWELLLDLEQAVCLTSAPAPICASESALSYSSIKKVETKAPEA